MNQIKLDFSRDAVRGTDFRKYCVANFTSCCCITSPRASEVVDSYVVDGLAVVVGLNSERNVSRGVIMGEEEKARGLVYRLKLGEFVEI